MDTESAVPEATKYPVGRVEDLRDGERRIVDIGGRRIGVFRVGSDFHAYENVCPHSGGPVCEGQIRPEVVGVVDEGGRLLSEGVGTSLRLGCPWHGWEFDLVSGVAVGDPERRLRRFDVDVDDGNVYVVV